MILIRNLGANGDTDPGGWREYELVVPGMKRLTFRHKRSDGLAVCLRKAATAVCLQEAADAIDVAIGDSISDDCGNTWSATCLECGRKSMHVVRPGKVQCAYCG